MSLADLSYPLASNLNYPGPKLDEIHAFLQHAQAQKSQDTTLTAKVNELFAAYKEAKDAESKFEEAACEALNLHAKCRVALDKSNAAEHYGDVTLLTERIADAQQANDRCQEAIVRLFHANQQFGDTILRVQKLYQTI